MSSARVQATPQSSLPFGEEAKPGFRTKTAATRLTPEELGEIEAAAESAGQALSEWLRGTALCAARQRPADPAELILAEVWAVRYALLNLFHAASHGDQRAHPYGATAARPRQQRGAPHQDASAAPRPVRRGPHMGRAVSGGRRAALLPRIEGDRHQERRLRTGEEYRRSEQPAHSRA